ncbi:hypothetical protein MLD38_028682 [Melastoma candidum]|nr:hypothetical protein MLD38_028682 [Melastoma candidum]
MREGTRGDVFHGMVFKLGFDRDVYVSNALLAFYCNVGEIRMSQQLFDGMSEKDIVSWNTMISGFIENGQEGEAVVFFNEMVCLHNLRPDNSTLVSILPACARTSDIRMGLWIHSYILKSGMELDSALGSGLISTYATSGHVKTAEEVFCWVRNKNLVVWDAMIWCYGMHGREEEALCMFSRMIELGLFPDGLVFLCVLSICSHAGLVKRGWEIFLRMEQYGVTKTEEHYACMVDLLGRAGLLSEALEVIESMPFPAGKDVYGALLGACRIQNNLALAEKVAEKLLLLEPDNAGRYMLLAKMYKEAGRLHDEARMRKLLSEKKIRRPVGCSLIEIGSLHHIFVVNDESHPSSQQIFETLKNLEGIMEDELVTRHG